MNVKNFGIICIASFLIGAGSTAAAGYYFIIRSNTDTYTKLEVELTKSRTEVIRLGTLVIRSDDIIRREIEINKRESEIAIREAENNRRTKNIYSELRDIIAGSYDSINSLESIAELVKKLEQVVNR